MRAIIHCPEHLHSFEEIARRFFFIATTRTEGFYDEHGDRWANMGNDYSLLRDAPGIYWISTRYRDSTEEALYRKLLIKALKIADINE